jgi:hypothetical protein
MRVLEQRRAQRDEPGQKRLPVIEQIEPSGEGCWLTPQRFLRTLNSVFRERDQSFPGRADDHPPHNHGAELRLRPQPGLGGDAAKLTIAIRVGLVPLDRRAGGSQPVRMSPGPAYLAHGAADMQSGNVVDVNGTAVKCHSWTAPEWNAFQIQFKQVVERFWNNQIILLPNDEGDPRDVLSDEEYREFIANPRIRARAEGALRVSLLPGGGAGQAMIEVVR